MTPMPDRPLFIPVILGTVRKGRMSEPCARLMTSELARRADVETELIDIARLPLRTDDAGEAIKDPGFSARMRRADALVIVAPEYNHGYSGLLKHVLDSCLEEYIHKAAGVVGVSAGVFGGVRGIQDLLPVLRELGLVTIFWDVNFGNVQQVFDASGALRDQSFLPRIDKFIGELVWMARTLRHGRERVAEDAAAPAVTCDTCGATMNRHAEKAVQAATRADVERADPVLGGVLTTLHACQSCGASRAVR
jgi:NAD(P)H-dependent FMN reductase